MATYSHRLASILPQFGSEKFGASLPGYPYEAILREVDSQYHALTESPRKWLRRILELYAQATTRYLLSNRASDLAEYAAQLGVLIDSLLNLGPASIPKFEYSTTTRNGARRAFLSAMENHSKPSGFGAGALTKFQLREELFLMLNASNLLAWDLETGRIPDNLWPTLPNLPPLTLSPENLLMQLLILRDHLKYVAEAFGAEFDRSEKARIFVHNRSAEHDLIARIDVWAKRFGFNRDNDPRKKTGGMSAFQRLIDLIMKATDEWLAECAWDAPDGFDFPAFQRAFSGVKTRDDLKLKRNLVVNFPTTASGIRSVVNTVRKARKGRRSAPP